MGRWGSPPPAVVPGLPGEWAALGRGLRERLERLARDLAPADAQDELPPPTPLLLSDLPKDLRAWYLGQGDVPAAGPGWPDEAWTFDEGAARRARLPMLTWSPGIDLSFRVAFVADTRPADASAAIAVLATAARLERELRLTDGAAECPEALADLVRSIDDGEGLQALLDAATSRSVAPLALKVQPGGPEVRQDELSLVLDLVLTAARGARLSPAARAEWRLAPRTGSSGRTRRG